MSGALRALGACAVGAALVLIAQAVTWTRTTVPRPTGGVQHVSVSGHDVASGLPAIGWALLALALALLAGSGVMRRVVGLVIVAVGVGGVAVAVAARGKVSGAVARAAFTPPAHSVHASAGIWWVVAALGAALAALAGVSAVLRGGQWGRMGARYEPPVAGDTAASALDPADPQAESAATEPAGTPEPATDDAEVWRALDRGEDPTAH